MRHERKTSKAERHRQACSVETLGLVIIALIIFILTLARYARYISWSWR